MNFNDLTDEQKAKARDCKTPEDLLALAQDEGVELAEEQLQAIAGGDWGNSCGDVCKEDAAQCTTHCPTAWHA